MDTTDPRSVMAAATDLVSATSQNQLSPRQLVEKTSGGLVLKGILVTNGVECIELQKTMIKVPDVLELKSPISPQKDNIVEFTSRMQSDQFHDSVNRLGHSMAVSGKGGGYGFRAEAGFSEGHHEEKLKESESHINEDYFSREIYTCVPTAVCELDEQELKLCEGVLGDLRTLERLTEGKVDHGLIEEKCKGILREYGSHINIGSIEFGGIYRWQATCSRQGSSSQQKVQSMVKDSLSGFISMSYSGPVINAGCLISGDQVKSEEITVASYTNEELSHVTLSVTKIGGPQEVTSLPAWKKGLIEHNATWAVIDRGCSFSKDFVGIWELIRNNQSYFNDAKRVADTIQHVWQSMNGIQQTSLTILGGVEDALSSLDSLLDKVTEWATDTCLSAKAVDYLQMLLRQVEQCCSVTGSKPWGSKLESHKGLADFLKNIMQLKDKYSPSDLMHVKYHLRKLTEVAGEQYFPMRAEIFIWISVERTKEEYIPKLMTKHTIKDIPTFTIAMKATLLPEMQLANNTSQQATTDLALAINHLRIQLEKDNKKYDLFLLMVALQELTFSCDRMGFDVLITEENLRKFVEKFDNLGKEFLHYKSVGIMEQQAFLIEFLVDSLTETRDPEHKEQKFQKFMEGIQDLLTSDIARLTSSSPHHWKGLCDTLHELKKGNKDVLNPKAIEISHLRDIYYTRQQAVKPDLKQDEVNAHPDEATPSGTLLSHLGLTEYYPSRISLQEVMAIRDTQSEEHSDILNLPWTILQKLIMFDYTCRDGEPSKAASQAGEDPSRWSEGCKENEFDLEDFLSEITSSEVDQIVLNPLDVFITVYSCCDLMLKQTLLQKMFLCRLGVPFITPQLSDDSLLFSLWALRSIIVDWKNKDQVCIETSVVGQPIKTASFVRLGKPSCSKSVLLNYVISDQAHNTFWNRECPLGNTDHSVADGLVEAQWCLPEGKETDTFKEATMFLNLRGNACDHKAQIEILQEISNVVVCFLETKDLDNPEVLKIMKGIHSSSSEVVLFLAIKDVGLFDRNVLRSQLNKYVKCSGANMSNTKIISAVKGNKFRTTDDLKQEIRTVICQLMSNQAGTSIESASILAKSAGIHIDEDDDLCKTAKQLADQVISCLGDKSTNECKTEMLPLQGDTLKGWSETLKENFRSGGKGSEPISMRDMASIQEHLTKIRRDQLSLCKSMSPMLKAFIANLVGIENPSVSTMFLQWLKLHFDEMSRNTLPGLHKEYHRKWMMFSSSKTKADSKKTDRLRNDLASAEKRLAEASLGVEHLLREVAQIYEAGMESKLELGWFTRKALDDLSLAAARLLLKGQPIEIMDGDAANVPLTWAKSVFSSLISLVGEKKMFVISVLGIQSSGKSTLLNTMFGLQFAVSAGRCTRGVYMQLMKVDAESGDLPYDYILVIDTEGLRAPELGQLKHDNDNQLATFVIGLGDVTIMNIKGENLAEVSDVLQIAVHAFLRMKITQKKRRTCIFIHQNVPAINAKEKMKHGCQKLQDTLDEMTMEACATEHIVDVHTFNDVIEFDSENNVWYFSDLWKGDPPMAPVNPGYTKKVLDVKNCLLNDLTQKQETFLTFSDMRLRITDIWNGVLSENFVFSFRNSLAAKAYYSLENVYQEKSWAIESSITEWTTQTAFVQMQKCTTPDELERCYTKLLNDLNRIASTLKENAISELKEFFQNHNLKEILIEWKAEKLGNLKNETQVYIDRAELEILQKRQSCRVDLVRETKQAEHDDEIMSKAKALAHSMKGNPPAEKQLQETFDKVWMQWVNDFAARATTIAPPPIADSVERILLKRLRSNSALLRRELEKNLLSKHLQHCELGSSFHLQDMTAAHISINVPFYKQWFAKLKELFNEEALRTKCQREAADAVNTILEEIDVYLSDIKQHNAGFKVAYASSVIKKVIDGVQKHNEQSKERFTLTKELMVKLAVHACCYAVVLFEEMQQSYDEDNSVAKKMDEYKRDAWILFKNNVNQCTIEMTAADLLENQLEALVVKSVQSRMSGKIVNEMLQYFSFQKYHLLTKILGELADGAFDGYKSFLRTPKSFGLQWITTFTNKEMFSADGDGRTKYANLAGSEIAKFEEPIRRSLQKAQQIVKSKKDNQNIKTWVTVFCAALVELPVKEDNLKQVLQQEVQDFDHFEKLLMEWLQSLTTELVKGFTKETNFRIHCEDSTPNQQTLLKSPLYHSIRRHFDRSHKRQIVESTPYQQIIDRLWGCEAVCPFCGEICSKTDQNHASATDCHQCIQHRQSGVGGISWNSSQKLTLETCNYKVQSDIHFRRDDEWRPYKEYKKYEPHWDIAPLSNMESSKYWMWVMATYKHQLATLYSREVPDIPHSWNQISKREAIDSLRVYTA